MEGWEVRAKQGNTSEYGEEKMITGRASMWSLVLRRKNAHPLLIQHCALHIQNNACGGRLKVQLWMNLSNANGG